MKYLKTIIVTLLFSIPLFVFAGNISVPSAPGANYVLISNAGGSYNPVATSSLGIAGSNSTSTADYIVQTNGGIVYGWKTSNNSLVSSNVSADVVLNAISSDASSNALSSIYVSPGTYYLNATTTFSGTTDLTGKTFVITGAGQSSTNFVVAGTTDGFFFSGTVKAILSNFTVFLSGSARAIVSSNSTGFRSLWNSNFSNLAFTGTTSNSTGFAFDLTNDDHDVFSNIYMTNIGNCFRSRTDAKNLFNPGDENLSNIWCSFAVPSGSPATQNTYTGGAAYTFDGSATSTIVNQNTLSNVGGFDPSGLRTAFLFNHASNIRGVGVEAEGFSTTTQNINSKFINLDFEYVIQSATSTNAYFSNDSASKNNTIGCTYVDSHTGTYTLFQDANTDANNPNSIRGILNGNCTLNGSGSFTFSTSSASLVNGVYTGTSVVNQSKPFSIPFDSTTVPAISVGTGANVSNYVQSFAAGRGMLGYDLTTGTFVLNSGNQKGFNFLVNGTNNTFNTGSSSIYIQGNVANGTVGSVGFGTTTPFKTVTVAGEIYASATTTSPCFTNSVGGTCITSGVASSRLINTTAPITGGGDLTADRTIACNVASGSQPGCLSSADWTTFNGKQSALSLPLSVSNGGFGTSTFQTGSIPFMGASNFTENNPKLFWDNTNNRLGLGTTTPDQLLSVYGNLSVSTSTAPILLANPATRKVAIGTSTPGATLTIEDLGSDVINAYSNGVETNPFFGVDNGNRAYLNGTAAIQTNVAELSLYHNFTTRFDPLIGTNLPADYPLLAQNTSGTNGSSTGIGFAVTNVTGTGGPVGAGIVFKRTNSNSQGELQFWNKQNTNAGGVLSQMMTISDTGKVGIGTSTPGSTLDVWGNLNVAVATAPALFVNTATTKVGIGTSSPASALEINFGDSNTTITTGNAPAERIINTNTTANNMEELSFTTNDTTGAALRVASIMGVNTAHTQNAMSGDLAFLTRSAGTYNEKARILANGQMGIGTSSPATTALFSVAGTSSALAFVNNGGTPTIATSTGIGLTTGTASIVGSDSGGQITVNTGTAPATGSTVVTITYAKAAQPYCTFAPANAITALLSGTSMIYLTSNSANFVLTSGSVALTGATTYLWSYTCNK